MLLRALRNLVEVDSPTFVTGTSEFGFSLADDSKLDTFDLAYCR